MVDFHSEYATIRMTCPKGIAPFLGEEVRELGYEVHQEGHTGVETKGTLKDCMFLNLNLKTGHKVLFLLQRFQAKGPEDLYQALKAIPWEEYIRPKGYFSIDNVVQNDYIQDTRFASLKTKDAIVDRFQEKYGKRPDSGSHKDQTVLFLFWQEEKAAIFLDTSGEPIAKHGYRKSSGPAPIAEPLAAAIVRATGWEADKPFVNPLCGTGTLAIEAALKGLNRPPGLFRDNFGFMHIRGYDSRIWDKVREGSRKNSRQSLSQPIIATDNDPKALKAAESNARKAGVLKFIQFRECELEDTPIPEKPGTMVINPPYGERMGGEQELSDFYKEIGDFFKRQAPGYEGYIFTGNLNMAKYVGLRTKCRIPFYNGTIECRLMGYDLYQKAEEPE